jgi:S-layer protein (TIGR01567 family)
MKRFAAVILAALMLLTVFASAASAAAVNETLDIRGPVFNGTNLQTIGNVSMDATNFAAFFYDIDNNVTTEKLSITKGTGNVIAENGLVYETKIASTDFEYEKWGNYSVLGFFADKYIPIKNNDASKLAKLVLDSDTKYTLKTGEKLDLGQGYALEAKQVDVDGEEVWLEFSKDGQYIDDEIVNTNTGSGNWTAEVDNVLGEDDVPVLKVHVSQVFQGAVDSIAQIDGLWLIDYANAMEIKSDDEFGDLNDVSLKGDTITISNEDTFTLTKDSDQEIGQGLFFRIADDSNALRFYAFKQITEPGTQEIRGKVASGTGAQKWDASNFAGFYYDLNDNVATESLSVSGLNNGNVIPENGLTYSTTIENVEPQYEKFGKFPVLGFFAEQYVPIKNNDASKLAKLILDSDTKYTLKTGEKLDLGQGYALEAKQVDVDGEEVWLEFSKDGQYIDDEIVNTNTGSGNWTAEVDNVLGEDDVPVLKVHVSQVFQGAVDSIAQIDGLWLIDYANAMEIKSDDEFGDLNDVSLKGDTISISNEDTFTLTRDSEQEIGQGMYFKVADTPTNEIRYYPYVEKVLGNATGNETSTSGPSVKPGAGNATNATNETNVTVPPTSGNGSNVTPTTPGETAPGETETTAANNTSKEGDKTPGFTGALLGISGLLAVIYLVRRNR